MLEATRRKGLSLSIFVVEMFMDSRKQLESIANQLTF